MQRKVKIGELCLVGLDDRSGSLLQPTLVACVGIVTEKDREVCRQARQGKAES